MDAQRLKVRARLILLGFVLVCAALLVYARPARRIATDVLELIPSDERQPELVLIRSLAGEQRARVALFALESPGSPELRHSVSAAFVDTLRKSEAIDQVVPMDDSGNRDELGQKIFQQRFNLLLPAWLETHRAAYKASGSREPWPQWLANRTAKELQDYLNRPDALAFQDLLPADPLLLMPGLVGSVKALDVAPAAASRGPILIWTTLRHPPLSEAGQQPVFDAVSRALHAAQAVAPDTRLRWTSLARFAAASRQRIERELSTLNTASILAVLGVAAFCIRRFWKAVNLIPVVLGSVLFAWSVTLAVFPRVHVLVFVVGALLTGVAIDYGFYLYLQPPAYDREPYASKAGRLLRPLLGSALTAILGFSLLTSSELPLIRQLGVFVSAGLLGAVTVALLWFAQIADPYIECRRVINARPKPTATIRRIARLLLLCGAVVALTGPWRLSWRDNIRQLETPAPELESEARDIRAAFGDRDDRTTYLTRGSTIEEARKHLGKFIAWHHATYPHEAINSMAQVLPEKEAWTQLQEERSELRDFPALLGTALANTGFEAAAFEPFGKAWIDWLSAPQPGYDAVARNLAESMRGPLGALFSVSPEGVWFVSIGEHAADRDPPQNLGTASASQLENLNRLFGRYRLAATHLSLLGLGLVGLSVFLIYGVRHGVGIFAVPLGACFVTFGIFGFCGQTLNLFHLLGAFLGVCLSHNYSIFTAENQLRHEAQPPSIRLSALATAASFGVLTFSHIPVVAALGSTVSLIVLSALAIVELKLLAQFSPPPAS